MRDSVEAPNVVQVDVGGVHCVLLLVGLGSNCFAAKDNQVFAEYTSTVSEPRKRPLVATFTNLTEHGGIDVTQEERRCETARG